MTTATLTKISYLDAVAEFKTLLRENGLSEAVAQWCGKPFTSWIESLEQGKDLTTLDDRRRLIAAMNNGCEVRDALLVTMLNNPKVRQLDTLLFLARPATNDETKQLTNQLLTEGMDDPEQLDPTRIQTITNILMNMCDDLTAANASLHLTAHPLATLAYVQCWTGKPIAAYHTATAALEADPTNTLAYLVIKMSQAGITPRAYQNINNQ